MCLWGQRGLRYDACTMYWGRSIQCSWSEPWTLPKRACLKWHCAFVISKPHTYLLLCIYHGDGGLSFTRAECKINSVSHLKDDISVTTHTHTRKKSRVVSLHSHGFIIVGVLQMCFRTNHKSQAYVNFCNNKKIIYSWMHLYKVCCKKEYLSLGTELLLSPRKERGELMRVESSSSVTTTPSRTSEKLFLIGAKLGAKESGHHAACNQCTQSSAEHMFLWETRDGLETFEWRCRLGYTFFFLNTK